MSVRGYPLTIKLKSVSWKSVISNISGLICSGCLLDYGTSISLKQFKRSKEASKQSKSNNNLALKQFVSTSKASGQIQ